MLRSLKDRIGQRSPIRLLWHRGKALLAAIRYGFPARRLVVLGITGTDGKTTTVGMVTHILRSAGVRVGAASTAFFDTGNGAKENPLHLTSINPFVLQKLLRTMVKNGCTHAVVEASSHGLVQHRLDWIWPRVAAITNIALEHLDYHGTMEQYRRDKAILFRMLGGMGTKILNARDPTFREYQAIPSERTIVWGDPEVHAPTKLWLTDTVLQPAESSARVHLASSGSTQSMELHLKIPGGFNLENALTAIGCALAVGVSIQAAVKALGSFAGIPGRLERIDEGQPFSVYVDFAVSPQAYEKALHTLRGIVGDAGRVMVLCSSCGNRMREKRPEIGRICSELADVVVACEDETYGEDPHTVLEEVWAGVDQTQCEAHKIFDRREAIRFLLTHARAGDAVVVCGMGPFSTMTKLEGRVPWDERIVTRSILQDMRF
ncbi:UDP-N-acetylmuramyl-tripeptide synthetase [Candidatus Peregrinibacteria bacterium]|nr:UDP-N-acetylmuramyl-tripeptide synthetase [Candidatus Peregrinibacteria bacterium]